MTASLQDRRTCRAARTVAEATDHRGPGNTQVGGGSWPDWAAAQLEQAARLAADIPTGSGVAGTLHRQWFAAALPVPRLPRRPLVGVYRGAHAAAGPGQRHDVIGADGWWRTWGHAWTPPRGRPGSVRVLFTVDPARLGLFVHTATAALLDEAAPWSLALAADPQRARRAGAAVLDLPGDEPGTELLDALVDRLAPSLLPVSAPLARPLVPGAALAQYPDNGMTFGEHRCHLVALGLRRAGRRDPLGSVAEVFAAHGIDPAHPYRTR